MSCSSRRKPLLGQVHFVVASVARWRRCESVCAIGVGVRSGWQSGDGFTGRSSRWAGFFPPRLLVEEPRGDERQCLVVMPPQPVADLVVAQARLALAALEAFLNAVFGLCRANSVAGVLAAEFERQASCLRVTLRRTFARDEQHRIRSRAAVSRGANPCAGLNAADRTSIASGPFPPSHTSSMVHAVSRSDVRHRSTRCPGVFGRRPRPKYSGGGTSASRNSVFDGTASR